MQSLEYSKPNQIEISNTLDETSKSQKEISQEITSIHSENTKIKTSLKIDIKHQKFPYCIVWTPIPFITYILPFIGHTGICSSNGIIHDFAGSYFVSVDDFAFGKVTKYVQLNLNEIEKINWDKAIDKGDERYNMETHNLFCNNCHSHCAYVLNVVNYKKKSNYNMVSIWWMVTLKSKYVNFMAFVKTYIGFFIFLFFIFLIKSNLD
jgi:hypothetical protein